MSGPQRLRVAIGWLAVLAAAGLLPTNAPAQQARTKESLQRIGVQRGVCVIVGNPDAGQVVDLARASELLLYVQLAGEKDVAAVRLAADEAGLLGTRIYVEQGDLKRVHLADQLADAVIMAADLNAAGAKTNSELLRVLRPGGRLIAGDQVTTKPRPAGVDEWSHPYHGPDNNPQSADQIARPPFLSQFFAEPWYCPMPQMSVIAGGRIIKAFGNRASAQPQWPWMDKLVAINAYNGVMLWKRDLKKNFMSHRNTLVATDDTVLLGDDTSCKLIDAATGKIRDEIVVPKELSDGPVWKWMALEGGVLYALVGEKESQAAPNRGTRYRGAGWPWWGINDYNFGYGRTLLAIDPKSKKILWHHREQERIDSRGTCMSHGRIYYFSDGKFLAALDAKTGKPLWKNSDKDLLAAIGAHGRAQNPFLGFASSVYAKCGKDAIFFAGPMRATLAAASTADGRLLWKHEGAGNSQLVLREDALFALGGGRTNSTNSSLKLNPITGEILARFASRDRCTRATGCVDRIFTRGGRGGSTAAFDVTLERPAVGVVSPMRPACQDGVVVAGGMLYWGPWKCRCDHTQIGVICLASGGDFNYAAEAKEAERLEVADDSPGRVAPLDVTAGDWPTFRGDNARSARTDRAVSDKAMPLWTFKPSGENVATAPITAGGLAVVSGSDGVVRAIESATGRPTWSAYTGGPVMYPPAIWQGRVYAGSGDGFVYCLEAKTGRRLWRFRAAPIERKIMIHGSLCSTWPVGGGVIVEKGVVYAAAGGANYDGTHVYALDAATGRIRWQNNKSGHEHPRNSASGAGVQGHLLLHGGGIYMAGGSLAPVVRYDTADGTMRREGGGFGKDLFVAAGRVNASGYPLYWRQEDWHYLSHVAVPAPQGTVAVTDSQITLLAAKPGADGKPRTIWSDSPVQEVHGIAVAAGAVVVAGVNRSGEGDNVKTTAAVAALDLTSGKPLWRHPLPAPPVSWGVAVDRDGRVLVSLQDGRVACFGEAK